VCERVCVYVCVRVRVCVLCVCSDPATCTSRYNGFAKSLHHNMLVE